MAALLVSAAEAIGAIENRRTEVHLMIRQWQRSHLRPGPTRKHMSVGRAEAIEQYNNTPGKDPAKTAIAWLKHDIVNSNETQIHMRCSGVTKILPRYMENRTSECLTRLKCSVFDPAFVARQWVIYCRSQPTATTQDSGMDTCLTIS
jgi:hypothetical protein